MSAITIRLFEKEKDYATVSAWWDAHKFPVVPAAVLPKLGIMAFDEQKEGICAGWLYMDNSVGVAMLEWVVTNPAQTPLRTVKGLNALVDFMESEAARMDYGVILTSCRQESLGKLFERHGFKMTDESVRHYLFIRRTD